MTATATITVRGQHVAPFRLRRRYAVVAVRPQAVRTEAGTYVAFAEVRRTTDSLDTATTYVSRYGTPGPGVSLVVVDLENGFEV